MNPLLYLSDRAIDELAIPPGLLRAALARAFRLHADNRTQVKPKLAIPLGSGHFFQSMCAAAPDLGVAGSKWVGVANANAQRGLPVVNSLMILNDVETGVPVAVLDGNRLTVLRTAAMSALAAEHLARSDCRSIGFIGCGVQAEGHLHALRDLLPDLRDAVCVSGGPASAERLAVAARQAGLAARASRDPKAALACDIVVTSVPVSDALVPFLDPADLQPGSFVAAVDLGRSWMPERLDRLDIVAIDDLGQSADPSTRARLGFQGAFHADLATLVTQAAPGRTTNAQRTMFLFPGFALADLAVAAAILEAARAAGRGHALPG